MPTGLGSTTGLWSHSVLCAPCWEGVSRFSPTGSQLQKDVLSFPTACCSLFCSEATGPEWAQMQKQTLASANIQTDSEV